MKLSTVRFIFLLSIFIMVISVIAIIIYDSNNKKDTEFNNGFSEQFNNKQSENYNSNSLNAASAVRVDGIDGLYFLSAEKHDVFKAELNKYLFDNGYSGVNVATVVGDVKTDDNLIYTFWLYISINDSVLKGTYNLDTSFLDFTVETDPQLLSNMSGIISTNEDGDYNPYSEEAEMSQLKTHIENSDILNDILSNDEFTAFENALNDFLVHQGEFRRYFVIDAYSIISSDDTLLFVCKFTTPRADNQNVIAQYTKAVKEYKFMLG